MKKNLKAVSSASIIMFALGVTLFTECIAAAAADTMIVVDPKVGGKAPGELYSANITISGVEDLVIWEFNLTFSTAVLEVVSVAEGPFLKKAGKTIMPEPVLNNTAGFVMATSALSSYAVGADGSGVLATIVFRVKAEGTSPLHLSELDKRWPYSFDGTTLVSIPYTAIDGVFIYPVELVHDIAVADIAVSSLTVVIGEIVSVNVTLHNKGNVTESFDVTLYYDSTVIETQTVSGLMPDRSETVTFEWRTRNTIAGDYVLTAVASAVNGEAATTDNSFSFAAVKVTEPSTFPIEILGLAVAIVAFGFVDLILFRKRSQSKTEPQVSNMSGLRHLQRFAEEKRSPT